MGHSENVSYDEIAARLDDDNFECREDSCSKHVSLEVDRRFWELYNRGVFDERDVPSWMHP